MVTMKHVWIGFKAIRPDDATRILVHPDLPEVGWIAEGFAKLTPHHRSHVNFANHPVVEREAQDLISDGFYSRDTQHHPSMVTMLA
jgi:hypothetical protein